MNYLDNYGEITGYGSPYWDKGLDVDLKVGDPVTSPVSGEVIFVGPNGGFGNQIKIKAQDGAEIWLSHLSAKNVNKGDRVSKGQTIALGGKSGKVIAVGGGDGSHLDITVKSPTGALLSARQVGQYVNTGQIPQSNGNAVLGMQQSIQPMPLYGQEQSQAIPDVQALNFDQPNNPSSIQPNQATANVPGLGNNFVEPQVLQFEDTQQTNQSTPPPVPESDYGLLGDKIKGSLPPQLKGAANAVDFSYETIKGIPQAGKDVYNGAIKPFIEPQTKGIASGIRALQSTGQMKREIGQAVNAISSGELYSSKSGQKVPWYKAFTNPVDTKFMKVSNDKGEFAEDIQKKALIRAKDNGG